MNHSLLSGINPRWTEDRRGWNRTWEKVLDKLYPAKPKRSESQLYSHKDRPWDTDVEADRLRGANDQREMLVTMQQALREYMSYHPNFDTEWLGMPRARQDEIVLEGLVRTCEIGPDMESRRFFVPESRMGFLAQRGGRGFLDLIAQIENASPHQPYLVPCKAYDAYIGADNAEKHSAEDKLWLLKNSYSRSLFLCLLSYNTVLAFYGEKAGYRMTKASNYKKLMRQLKTSSPEQYGDLKETMKHSEWCCRTCGDVESSLPQGQRLLTCAKCKAIGRVVKYCGKNCQKRDWGTHKVFCGKADNVSAEEALEKLGPTGAKVAGTAGNTSLAFPMPVPPFVPSRHLRYQMQLIRDHPPYEYVYVRPTGEQRTLGILVDEGPVKDMFLSARERAFRSGDIDAVLELYAYLGIGLRGDSALLQELQRQLSLEYGVDAEVFSRTFVAGPSS
ncbi:hypothetical protein AURDEDRAFT_109622 [Auricularia subglabra TFB-10046 SS5]|nr:hypothetical protein AURDEDRAFT_109622 [Auricularia subglabra TFB-10046 SS5]